MVVMYCSSIALVRGNPELSPYSSSMSVSTASKPLAAHWWSIIDSMIDTVEAERMSR